MTLLAPEPLLLPCLARRGRACCRVRQMGTNRGKAILSRTRPRGTLLVRFDRVLCPRKPCLGACAGRGTHTVVAARIYRQLSLSFMVDDWTARARTGACARSLWGECGVSASAWTSSCGAWSLVAADGCRLRRAALPQARKGLLRVSPTETVAEGVCSRRSSGVPLMLSKNGRSNVIASALG
jgi:hypothetical protein